MLRSMTNRYIAFIMMIAVFVPMAIHAQFIQQGNKLYGSGAVGNAEQGYSVSTSGDGNTVLVGGPFDSSYAGAAWVFTRTAGVWSQQGSKLFGSGENEPGYQGYSVSLSADGNTALIGGPGDSTGLQVTGAAWIYTRNGGVWSQQGTKLVGTGCAGDAQQGYSVALSADGNTAIVGGYPDSSFIGAAWVFTRSGGVWTQEGEKLVGSGASGPSQQGYSVSLSADGNTAVIGGNTDSAGTGAVWVFTRSGHTWTQQGAKLVGDDLAGASNFGNSVSLSADGNTMMAGGYFDAGYAGATWVFTRSGNTWTQQGSKITGTGGTGSPTQGYSVSLSSDGNTALSGGANDNVSRGAAWVFNRAGSTWSQNGNKLVASATGNNTSQGASVALSGDGFTAVVGGFGDSSTAGAAWVFTELYYYITASSGSNGSISPSDSVKVAAGAGQRFTFSPSANYRVDSVFVDGAYVDSTAGYTFVNVAANHTISVKFTLNSFTITATAGPNGTITPSGAVLVIYGNNRPFAITPATGYHIDSLIIDNVAHPVAAADTFKNVTANHTIHVAFAINVYTIIASAGNHGSISPVDTVRVAYGSDTTFTMTPAPGYKVNKITIDGIQQAGAPTYAFHAVSANHTISVTFSILAAYSTKYRTFTYDSLIVQKAVKKKNITQYWEFKIRNTTLNPVTEVNIAFANDADSIISSGSLTRTGIKKAWKLTGTLAAGDSITLKGLSPKPKAQSIAKLWLGPIDRSPDTSKMAATVNISQLPMPNAASVRDDIFARALTGQGGLIIGVVKTDSAKFYGWVRMKKSADMFKSSYDKNIGKHATINNGFRTLATGRPFVREQSNLSPAKQNNRTFADLMTLKFNIAMSALGISTRGFDVLQYTEAGSPFAGKLVKDIAALGDSMMTFAALDTFANHPELYGKLDTAMMHINAAFSDDIDTVSWSDSLKLTGTVRLIDTHILVPSSEPAAVIVPRLANGLDAGVPKAMKLYQNYPNPFNPTTNIQFDLTDPMIVTLKIYNILGQEVMTLIDHEQMDEGNKEAQFDGSSLASGVYFYRITAQPVAGEDGTVSGHSFISSNKMVLVK